MGNFLIMCGIIITKDETKLDLIKHRGIESNFIKFKEFYYCHHRLPIQTNIGDKWKQPLFLNNNKGLLLFNGEIFNYDKNKYSSDSEYLFDLFSNSYHVPIDEISKWDGFWSIVWSNGNDIYCFTDPLGKKQLYYNTEGEICSEIFPLVLNSLDYDLLFKSQVFKWGYNNNDRTVYNHIKRILPNKFYHFKNYKLNNVSNDYFNWNEAPDLRLFKEFMFKSVEDRLISKSYGIGCLVSGGLDSSIIASILTTKGANVNYYSIENNESKYIEILKNYLGIDIKYLDYLVNDDLFETFKFNDSPIDLGSVVPQHKLFSVIPEKIVLSGDGADELFGGYKRINDYDSQRSDIFDELTFYHLPRLDRASMRYTIELRNPFLSHDIIRMALKIPYPERINKVFLKSVFNTNLPDEILYREKVPLKNSELRQNPMEYRKKIFDLYYNKIINND